jgi:hypothetical protein
MRNHTLIHKTFFKICYSLRVSLTALVYFKNDKYDDNIYLAIIPSLCKSLLEVKKENAIFPIHRNIEIGTATAAKMTGINVERVEC